MLELLLKELADKNKQKKIIYPEINDQRVFDAVSVLRNIGESPVICGKKHELIMYQELIKGGLEYFIVPENKENTIFAVEKVVSGEVDGFIGGNISTTSEIVRVLIKNIRTKKGISRISSHFLFGRKGDLFLYGDIGIQIDPSPEQLAEIAYLSIQSALRYNMTPRVAMLSFSTSGSGGNHPKILKIREATQILKNKLKIEGMGEIPVEGEIQFDAAFIPEIGQIKNNNTSLLKPANIFIFPDLDSANIAYKITERLGGATALGPIIQGLSKPGNDLSRGCNTEDIIALHHITKNA